NGGSRGVPSRGPRDSWARERHLPCGFGQRRSRLILVQRFGFLSFGHWRAAPGSQVRTAADALNQTVELAVAAEELGAHGAFVRVHHFARQLASPFPLLTAMAMRTSRIELGTGVIDM